MSIKKTIIALAFSGLFGSSAMAQECCSQNAVCPRLAEAQELGYFPQPYGFVQLQAGAGTLFSPGKQYNPTFSLGLGYMFNPAIGLRLHANGYEAKNGFHSVDDTYKFKYVNTNLDLMVNLTNIINKTTNPFFNVYLVAGTGLAYAWDNDELHNILATGKVTENCTNAWGEGTTRQSLLSHNIRAGLLLDFNIAKNWSLGAEFDINNLSDRFNSKYDDACDWAATAQISLTYKFGHKKCEKPAPVVVTEPVVEPEPVVVPEPEPVVVPEPEPIPEPVVKEEPLREVVYFDIRQSNPFSDAIVAKCKKWLEEYPGKNITVSGYADKGTGNAKLNMGYSKQRTESAVKALVKAGIPADRIDSAYYGDTVQPFAENDANRCVIIEGK